jgi:hypothetical protein
MTGQERHQLLRWCELLIEDSLDRAETARFEQLVLADAEARGMYIEYVTLHGLLAWDAAGVGATTGEFAPVRTESGRADSVPAVTPARSIEARPAASKRLAGRLVATAALLVVAVTAVLLAPHFGADNAGPGRDREVVSGPEGDDPAPPDENPGTETISPLQLPGGTTSGDGDSAIATTQDASPDPAETITASNVSPSAKQVVEVINTHMAEIWEDYEVESSVVADDAEWLRRCYLDLVGHIPPADVVSEFVADRSQGKRDRMIDGLLASSGHTRHVATVWTNLLVGRRPRPQADRDALAKFLREQFHSNAPWSETVAAMLTAEGRGDENPASNFLLAHLNNEAVPATAVACRLFLGQQMLCAQCHKHPEHGWEQERFWQLNACFQQTDVVADQEYDPQTGTMRTVGWRLEEEPVAGPTYYEDRQGVVHAAYPGLDDAAIDDGEATDRRDELMQLLLADDRHQMAAAFVNRTWSQMFGYALVTPVDDLGPHSTSIHADLLRELSAAFVASNYNVRELYRWICLSQPYQLSSRFSATNEIDDPAAGEPPLFSRMYLRSLSPEQLFDSLVVATSAGQAGASDWDDVEAARKSWAQAFYQSADTDDNTELSSYEGSYSQALVLMNGDLVQSALEAQPGGLLFEVLSESNTEAERLERLWLATLSRPPTEAELSGGRRLVQQTVQLQTSQGAPLQVAQATSMGDMLWALLNSSEFSVIH